MNTALNTKVSDRPIGFFVHHHGRGHAMRFNAIANELSPRPITVFTAAPEHIDRGRSDLEIIDLPNTHGELARSKALHDLAACCALDCAPVGVRALSQAMSKMASWMGERDPVLFVSDVSAEVSMLARVCSVPCVKIRMHGQRGDAAHHAAYSGSAGLLAPFDKRLEQEDWPQEFRDKTFYCGGIVASNAESGKACTKAELGLPKGRPVIVAIAGGGGAGVSMASISLGARALPNYQWVVVGKVLRQGHETDFPNVTTVGWSENVSAYLEIADIVVATAGDTLVHEALLRSKPLITIPEWCYYDEQRCKSEVLDKVGAAVHSESWPGHFERWRELVDRSLKLDPEVQKSFNCVNSAKYAAKYLDNLIGELWSKSTVPT